jgi:hypothetical protein
VGRGSGLFIWCGRMGCIQNFEFKKGKMSYNFLNFAYFTVKFLILIIKVTGFAQVSIRFFLSNL